MFIFTTDSFSNSQYIMKIISKYKNAQLVFVDGKIPARIKRVMFQDGGFVYEVRETGEIFPEERISLIKN
jgi:hypothetical protein